MLAVSAFLFITLLIFGGKVWEDVDAGEIVFIQDPIDGDIHVNKEPGFAWQMFGRATHMRKSNQFWFEAAKKEGDPDQSIAVKWNDGGHASISGSVRYDLPLDDASLVRLLSTYGTQEGLEAALIKANMEKSVFMTGPLMSSKESYAEKRNDLIYFIEDQASKGVYKTKQKEAKELDPLTNEEKTVTRVEIQLDSKKLPIRQETSPILTYGIKLYNISINGITYSKDVEDQIQAQQRALMSVQTAVANSKKAEQDVITTAKQGEARAATAKWDQEVIKAKMVTEAESRRKVAELDVQTAELNKQRQIKEGEGEAAKRKLIMAADGSLDKRLEAYKYAVDKWATAFGGFQGAITPMWSSSPGGSSNAFTNQMEMINMKTMRDLSLELKSK
jgi:regulator of protease activity HflC (stomatin/prohibitin superfamily)